MNHSLSLGLLSLVSLLAGCVTRPFPVHGGGKRFIYEQEALSRAIRGAIDRLDFAALKGRVVRLEIRSVGDAGGGTEAKSGGFNPLGIFGTAAILGGSSQGIAVGAVGASVAPPRSELVPEVFANAEDLKFLEGEILRKIYGAEGRVALNRERNQPSPGPADQIDGILYVQVANLGMAKSDLDFILYSQKEIECRAAVSAFFVGVGPKEAEGFKELKSGESTCTYTENFILGIGPLNGGKINGGLEHGK